MLPNIPPSEYPGQALVCALYEVGGIRAVEIGSVMFGKYDAAGQLDRPMELVRLAIPRRVYTQSHMEYVIEVFEEVLRRKRSAEGFAHHGRTKISEAFHLQTGKTSLIRTSQGGRTGL